MLFYFLFCSVSKFASGEQVDEYSGDVSECVLCNTERESLGHRPNESGANLEQPRVRCTRILLIAEYPNEALGDEGGDR